MGNSAKRLRDPSGDATYVRFTPFGVVLSFPLNILWNSARSLPSMESGAAVSARFTIAGLCATDGGSTDVGDSGATPPMGRPFLVSRIGSGSSGRSTCCGKNGHSHLGSGRGLRVLRSHARTHIRWLANALVTCARPMPRAMLVIDVPTRMRTRLHFAS